MLCWLYLQKQPQIVVNLAAQAGVRYSLENPLLTFKAIWLDSAMLLRLPSQRCENLIYASSSSVYGGNRNLPFNERQAVNHPVSLYAATKKANELVAHTYSHLYGLPATGLRFLLFMDLEAARIWLRCCLRVPSWLGSQLRCLITAVCSETLPTLMTSSKVWFVAALSRQLPTLTLTRFTRILPLQWHPIGFNIGNSQPIELLRFIGLIENALERKAVKDTAANTTAWRLKPLRPTLKLWNHGLIFDLQHRSS